MMIMIALAIVLGIFAVIRSFSFLFKGYFPLYDSMVLIFIVSYLILKGVG